MVEASEPGNAAGNGRGRRAGRRLGRRAATNPPEPSSLGHPLTCGVIPTDDPLFTRLNDRGFPISDDGTGVREP